MTEIVSRDVPLKVGESKTLGFDAVIYGATAKSRTNRGLVELTVLENHPEHVANTRSVLANGAKNLFAYMLYGRHDQIEIKADEDVEVTIHVKRYERD